MRARRGEPLDPRFVQLLEQVEREAARLDTRFCLPGTRFRLGWDPIMGLVPILGDLVAAGFGLRLVVWANCFGLGPALIAKMLLNVVLDLALGVIPVAGPVFDAFYRSNTRNLALLLAEMKRQFLR